MADAIWNVKNISHQSKINYQKDNLLEYDLEKLKDKIDITTSLKKQIDSSKESQKLLETLLIDYNKTNQLDNYKELLESLSKKRYKNSIDKKKIMKKLINEELSDEEKIIERQKYAILIQENKEFIDIINELRKPNTNYIMIQNPKVTIHNKDDN